MTRYHVPRRPRALPGALLAVLAVAAFLGLAGCSKTAGVIDPIERSAGLSDGRAGMDVGADGAWQAQGAIQPPTGLVGADFGAAHLSFWPWTGASFDGTPSDPVNVIFAGKADPLRIRAALMALDGDRTAFGLPDAYPFNARWSDAYGDVQTNYAEGPGWMGSVIQLQLGQYEPIRAHLRLFRTGVPAGDGGEWTVGAAHFEILIPGTADHAVISWEVAEQLVTIDMMRTGLLDAAVPMMPSAPINGTTFRTIDPMIYNGLPPELVALIHGPAQPVSEPVPISNGDGAATIFNLTGLADLQSGSTSQDFTLTYNQVIPRPICSAGPYDFILVQGPLTFHKETYLDETGRFTSAARFQGNLTGVPLDVTKNPPEPAGAPFPIVVNDNQHGYLDARMMSASMISRQMAPGNGGTEFVQKQLTVTSTGQNSFRLRTRCSP